MKTLRNLRKKLQHTSKLKLMLLALCIFVSISLARHLYAGVTLAHRNRAREHLDQLLSTARERIRLSIPTMPTEQQHMWQRLVFECAVQLESDGIMEPLHDASHATRNVARAIRWMVCVAEVLPIKLKQSTAVNLTNVIVDSKGNAIDLRRVQAFCKQQLVVACPLYSALLASERVEPDKRSCNRLPASLLAVDADKSRTKAHTLLPSADPKALPVYLKPPMLFVASYQRSGTHFAMELLANSFQKPLRVVKANHVAADNALGCECLLWMKTIGRVVHVQRNILDVLVSSFFYRRMLKVSHVDHIHRDVDFPDWLMSFDGGVRLIREWRLLTLSWRAQPGVVQIDYDSARNHKQRLAMLQSLEQKGGLENLHLDPFRWQLPQANWSDLVAGVAEGTGRGQGGWRQLFRPEDVEWVALRLSAPLAQDDVNTLLMPEWWKQQFLERAQTIANTREQIDGDEAMRQADAIDKGKPSLFAASAVDSLLSQLQQPTHADICAHTQRPPREDYTSRVFVGELLMAPDSCRQLLGENREITVADLK